MNATSSQHTRAVVLPSDVLRCHPEGTRVRIAGRTFVRLDYGSFWREESHVAGNQVARPSVSLETLENQAGRRHEVIEVVETEEEAQV